MVYSLASFSILAMNEVVAEIIVWVLALAAAGALIAAAVLMKHPYLVGKGQDPAGKGMAAGCLTLLAFTAATVLSVIATFVAFSAEPSVSAAARVAAPVPVTIVVLFIAVCVVAYQIENARQMDKQWAELMKIPIYVLVDSSDERLTGMYNALRQLNLTMEMHLYKNAMAFWWQRQDHLPRVRLMCLQAEGMDQQDEVQRTSLLATLERWKPTSC